MANLLHHLQQLTHQNQVSPDSETSDNGDKDGYGIVVRNNSDYPLIVIVSTDTQARILHNTKVNSQMCNFGTPDTTRLTATLSTISPNGSEVYIATPSSKSYLTAARRKSNNTFSVFKSNYYYLVSSGKPASLVLNNKSLTTEESLQSEEFLNAYEFTNKNAGQDRGEDGRTEFSSPLGRSRMNTESGIASPMVFAREQPVIQEGSSSSSSRSIVVDSSRSDQLLPSTMGSSSITSECDNENDAAVERLLHQFAQLTCRQKAEFGRRLFSQL